MILQIFFAFQVRTTQLFPSMVKLIFSIADGLVFTDQQVKKKKFMAMMPVEIAVSSSHNGIPTFCFSVQKKLLTVEQ